MFLLSAAAVANITFLHPQACSALLQMGAPQLLIKASSVPKARSLFARDQVRSWFAKDQVKLLFAKNRHGLCLPKAR